MKVLLFFALFKSSTEALWELSFALSAVRKTSAVFHRSRHHGDFTLLIGKSDSILFIPLSVGNSI